MRKRPPFLPVDTVPNDGIDIKVEEDTEDVDVAVKVEPEVRVEEVVQDVAQETEDGWRCRV